MVLNAVTIHHCAFTHTLSLSHSCLCLSLSPSLYHTHSFVGRKPSRNDRGGHGTHMAGILAGADPTMLDPPSPGAANLAAGAVALCNDLDAVAACASESVEGVGLQSEECFTAVFQYAKVVPECAELHGPSLASSLKLLVNAACKQGLHCIGQRAYNHNSLTPEVYLQFWYRNQIYTSGVSEYIEFHTIY